MDPRACRVVLHGHIRNEACSGMERCRQAKSGPYSMGRGTSWQRVSGGPIPHRRDAEALVPDEVGRERTRWYDFHVDLLPLRQLGLCRPLT